MARLGKAAVAVLCWPLACSSEHAASVADVAVDPATAADGPRITGLTWDVLGPTGCDNPLATDDDVQISCAASGDAVRITLTVADVTGDCTPPARGSRCRTVQAATMVWGPPWNFAGNAPATTVLVTCRAVDQQGREASMATCIPAIGYDRTSRSYTKPPWPDSCESLRDPCHPRP